MNLQRINTTDGSSIEFTGDANGILHFTVHGTGEGPVKLEAVGLDIIFTETHPIAKFYLSRGYSDDPDRYTWDEDNMKELDVSSLVFRPQSG
jgi:hypothetical protein